MELIKGRYDDLNNKIRPGAYYVNKRNDNFDYIDKDGAKAQLIPESRYYAVETIKRGQPISIAQKKDLVAFKEKFEGIWDSTGNTPDGWDPENDPYSYCKITDPDVDDTCLGIAMNYAEPGQIVSVQSRGKFSFLTTKHPDFETRKDREVFIDIDAYKAIPFDQITGKYEKEKSEFNFDQVRGQPLYIRKSIETLSLEEDGKLDSRGSHTGYDKEGDLHDTDHLDTSRKADAEVDGKAWFTWDYSDSIYNTKNTIQVGYLTDAPTTGGADDEVVTIELNITGDTRGPIDNTQFLVTLGEDIYFNKVKQDLDLEDEAGGYDSTSGEPDFARLNERGEPSYNRALNTGVYDEVKVLAIAEGKPRPFSCKIRVVGEAAQGLTLEDAFIGLRRLDGKTIIIPVVSEPIDFDDLADPNDEGYIKLSKSFLHANDEIVQKEPLSIFTPNIIRSAITEGLQELQQSYHTDEEVEFTSHEVADGVFEITSNVNEGYYDVYVSHNLLPFISVREIEHGQSAEAGQAILADVRDASRLNVLGVVLTNQSGWHKKGDVVKVLRMGRMVTMGNLKPGTQYYLGLNGRITARPQYWYDFNVPIGIAESCNYFIIDVKEPLRDYSGNFPLGYIKPSNRGLPEKGFALMDGITLYDKRKYPELYNALKNWFDEDDLKPSKVTREQFNATMAQKYYEFFGEINEYMVQIHNEASGWRSTMDKYLEDFAQYQEDQSQRDVAQDEALTNTATAIRGEEAERARLQAIKDAEQEEALANTAANIRSEEEERARLQGLKDEAQDEAIAKAEEWDDDEHEGTSLKEYVNTLETNLTNLQEEFDRQVEYMNGVAAFADKMDAQMNDVESVTFKYRNGYSNNDFTLGTVNLTNIFKANKWRTNEASIYGNSFKIADLCNAISDNCSDPSFSKWIDGTSNYWELTGTPSIKIPNNNATAVPWGSEDNFTAIKNMDLRASYAKGLLNQNLSVPVSIKGNVTLGTVKIINRWTTNEGQNNAAVAHDATYTLSSDLVARFFNNTNALTSNATATVKEFFKDATTGLTLKNAVSKELKNLEASVSGTNINTTLKALTNQNVAASQVSKNNTAYLLGNNQSIGQATGNDYSISITGSSVSVANSSKTATHNGGNNVMTTNAINYTKNATLSFNISRDIGSYNINLDFLNDSRNVDRGLRERVDLGYYKVTTGSGDNAVTTMYPCISIDSNTYYGPVKGTYAIYNSSNIHIGNKTITDTYCFKENSNGVPDTNLSYYATSIGASVQLSIELETNACVQAINHVKDALNASIKNYFTSK